MTRGDQAGLSLVEVVLALGICSVGILLLIGLLPVGLQTEVNARHDIQLAQLAAAICADLQAAPSGSELSAIYGLRIPKPGDAPVSANVLTDSHGRPAPESRAELAQYRIQVWMTPPPQPDCKSATQARVLIQTPALKKAPATAEYEALTAFDRNP
jgi:uncharacterized protein (TIGR02598 family)